MLGFFRKYQTYFFIFITIIIIISFSFFGTYSTLGANAVHEQVAFSAIDGTEVSRRDLEEVYYFISTDAQDKLIFGGVWGPNFLNDGVIRSDFLETGLGELLAISYADLIARDIDLRAEKEKHFKLYKHPQVPFIGVETAWNYFIPGMSKQFESLRTTKSPTGKEAISARIGLYLNERRFPAPILQQVLAQQQKQFKWVKPDPSLERIDLSLFGYHTLEDWFGPRFLRILSEFIINASKLAEEKGYVVTKEEALADLMQNTDISYQQNFDSPHLGVGNRTDYFNEQLRRLGMDQNKAVKVWRQVLLFRRLFHDVGNAALVDALTHKQFFDYAQATVNADLYRWQPVPESRISDFRTMQKLEVYLDALTKRQKDSLALPSTYLSIVDATKQHPELVQNFYLLSVSQINKNALQKHISIKETWNWEVEEGNFKALKEEFAELGTKPSKTPEERFAALEGLDDATRTRVDAYARKAIVDAHPEWIQKGLAEAASKEISVGIRLKGGKKQFGLDDRTNLIKLLDKAPIRGQEINEDSRKIAEQLSQFTGDKENYYRISVIERQSPELLTFADANREGVLDAILDQKLEAYYKENRESNPSWKNFKDVKNEVAELLYENILKTLRKEYVKVYPELKDKVITPDMAASIRAYPHMKQVRNGLQKGETNQALDSTPKRITVADQWKLIRSAHVAQRAGEEGEIKAQALFSLPIDAWSEVQNNPNGDLYFFQVKAQGTADITAFYNQLDAAHRLIANAAQQNYLEKLLPKLKEAKAISLDYLDANLEEIEPEVPSN